MRIAVLILGLILGAFMLLQSLLITGLGSAADRQNTADAGAVGLFMALLWLIGCAVVIPLPRVAMILFIVAGLLGFAVSGDFPDLGVWGGVSLFLAVLSYFGYRGKRKQQRQEAVRDLQLQESLVAQQQMAAQMANMQQQWGQPGQEYQQPRQQQGPAQQAPGDAWNQINRQ